MAETTGPMKFGTSDASQSNTDELSADQQARVIRDSISQTRNEMGRTVTAIEERLSPARLKEQVLEQFHDAKETVKTELKEDFADAKQIFKEEVGQAKQTVKDEIDHAKHAVRDATIGRVEHMMHDAGEAVTEVRTTVMDTIRANPIPAAMIGLGLGWLIMSIRSGSTRQTQTHARSFSQGGQRRYGNVDDRSGVYGARGGYQGFDPYTSYDPRDSRSYEGAMYDRDTYSRGRGGSETGAFDQAQHAASDAVHRVQSAASGAAHRVGDAASHVAHDAEQRARGLAHDAGELAHQAREGVARVSHDVRDQASHFAHEAGDRVRSMAHEAQRRAQRVERSLENSMEESPLVLGAVALAVGTGIGLALPSTRRENQILGGVHDTIVQGAEELVHQAADKARDVAGEAKRAIADAVTGEGHNGSESNQSRGQGQGSSVQSSPH